MKIVAPAKKTYVYFWSLNTLNHKHLKIITNAMQRYSLVFLLLLYVWLCGCCGIDNDTLCSAGFLFLFFIYGIYYSYVAVCMQQAQCIHLFEWFKFCVALQFQRCSSSFILNLLCIYKSLLTDLLVTVSCLQKPKQIAWTLNRTNWIQLIQIRFVEKFKKCIYIYKSDIPSFV